MPKSIAYFLFCLYTIHSIFTQVVLMLVDMGHLTLNESFIDGTKMESRANRYTFVWRKFFANPTDFLTFIPFNKRFGRRYGFFPKKVIADSGYGSEENYDFMQTCETERINKS